MVQGITILPPPSLYYAGKNNQAVPTAIRKTSMELRNESQAANACEGTRLTKFSHNYSLCMLLISIEPDGLRQISPESPIRPVIGDITSRKFSSTAGEAAEGSSMRLKLPHHRIRRTSEPHPRYTHIITASSLSVMGVMS